MGSIVLNLSLGDKNDVKDYLFKDIAFDLKKTQNNRDVAVSKDWDAVSNGIYNIFLFAPGERIILPDFGNTLYKFVYEPLTDDLLNRMRTEIREMIERWEPRVNIIDIQVTGNPDMNEIDVVVLYTVPALGEGTLRSFNTAVNARR